MKNLKISKNAIRRSLALISIGIVGTTSAISFSGCSSEGWHSDDYSIVQERVSEITEAKRQAIISECGREGTNKNLSTEEINYEIYRRFDEENLLREDEKETYARYKEMFSNSYVEEETSVYSLN